DGIRDFHVTGVQTCALPISRGAGPGGALDDVVDPPVPPRAPDGGRPAAHPGPGGGRRLLPGGGHPRTHPVAGRAAVPPTTAAPEIGRASCRERAQSPTAAAY